MTIRVLTFGEMMMRLKTPGFERFSQARSFEADFGGAEANVAVALARFGCESVFLTVLPNNPLGDKARSELRSRGVHTEHIIVRDGRLGLYFMEAGVNQRAGQVVYDRENSVFSTLMPGALSWQASMKSVDWFHLSGITPAVGQNSADLSLEGMQAAKNAGATVSIDLNYRSKLWNYGRSPQAILPDFVRRTDVLIAGRDDCQHMLDITGDGDPDSDAYFSTLTQRVMEQYPNIQQVAVTIRQTLAAQNYVVRACLRDASGFRFSKSYAINHAVDRVGTGDAFAAGLIFGLGTQMTKREALEFAVAANCLKHSVSGDFSDASIVEIQQLMKGSVAAGRVVR